MKRKRRVVKKGADRKDALTWLLLGVLVGGILVFCLFKVSVLSSPQYSPVPNQCILKSTDRILGNCNDVCANVNRDCAFGQNPDSKSVIPCSYSSSLFEEYYCVCCT